MPKGLLLFVDLVGLFHPETDGVLDLKVWCDTDIVTAQQRGMARDAALGRNHEVLWHSVWTPNEREFDTAFVPRDAADVLYRPDPAVGSVDGLGDRRGA